MESNGVIVDEVGKMFELVVEEDVVVESNGVTVEVDVVVNCISVVVVSKERFGVVVVSGSGEILKISISSTPK